ncbi:unnamed protein product [Symbiodinium natans]|uniref:Nucleotide-diphospho-sugar transferase domain-containing protein n=1 Tax=Symbiodinium natans TaxID=878477 RepID=A0A812PZ47_9DINO|nr:unnamed protein product [Symbiodinium natans]
MRHLWLCVLASLPGATAVGRQSLIRHEVLAEGAAAGSHWVEQAEVASACVDCCNDGKAYVPCLDVQACAAQAPATGRYALIFSYVGRFVPKVLEYLNSARAAALSANKADLLLLMTKSDVKAMDASSRRDLEKQGVQLRIVDWSLPPGMRFTKEENWCGQKDFIRLHALGLEEYDAVAYFDNDIEFQGDITPLLRCAAGGHFLTTNGGIGEALNVGFFALQPHKALLQAAVDFARQADYSELTGWANEGWRPSGGYYVGGECGQGFFHALFYKRSASLRARLGRLGRNWTSAQVDKCVWNYQTSFQCRRGFDCRRVRVHHKPTRPGSDPEECLKSQARPKSPESSRTAVMTSVSAQAAFRQDVAVPAQVGFYFPVHDQVEGVVAVLRSARQFYPESPIYVLQDGGSVDFGGLCRQTRYRCTFERVPGENSRWNPHSWFARMRRAAELLQTQYIIYLEPDVKITRRHRHDFPYDAGGVHDNFNPIMSLETKAYLERLGRQRNPCFNVSWAHFGLCGGSYYRTEAVLDAFRPEHVLSIDWRRLQAHEGVDKTMSSDFAMAVALAARGWTVYPWEESAQKFSDVPTDPEKLSAFAAQWPALNPSAAFQHNHKELYHADISAADRALCSTFADRPPDTTCHGCVWYKDGRPESRLSIPSEPPLLEGPTSFDFSGPSEAARCHRPAPQSLLLHPDYLLNAGSEGLPQAAGPRPSWLVREDLLVVDARPQAHGGMLILQPVFMEAGPLWGTASARPRWLRAILATNRHHARLHGLCLVIRWLPSKPQLQPWQQRQCGALSEKECTKRFERENFNWEKHRMLQEYLMSPQSFSHVMLLDADAALIRHERNILADMAAMLDKEGRDVLFTDEDWLLHGASRINGGVILAKGSQWSQDLFRDTVDAHVLGPQGLKTWRVGIQDHQCSSNEQICLNDVIGLGPVKQRTLLASGVSYNRGGCTVRKCGEPISDSSMEQLGMEDARLRILHFMGDHALADNVLCDGPVDYTGEGPKGFGCSVLGSSLLALNASAKPAINESEPWTFLCC